MNEKRLSSAVTPFKRILKYSLGVAQSCGSSPDPNGQFIKFCNCVEDSAGVFTAFENTKVFKYSRSPSFSFSSEWLDGLKYEPYPWVGYLDFDSMILSRAGGRKVLMGFLVAKLKFLKDAKTGRDLLSFNWWNICLRALGVSSVGVEEN